MLPPRRKLRSLGASAIPQARAAPACAVLAALAGVAFTAPSGAAHAAAPDVGRAQAQAVSVHVQRNLAVSQNVHISFRPRPLPQGGYYYAVLVLKPYRNYTRASPPPCATSSNMQRTDYGYPRGDGQIALALTPASSRTGQWCRAGAYLGAVYAVPHRPPCGGRYPCRSEPYEPPSPCWQLGGRVVCGVVALPRRYAYPDGLPRPLASGTRIVARFTVGFPR
jgi:hypothetical protein